MTLTRYEGIRSVDAVEKAQQVMLAEYDEVESEQLERTISGRELSGIALRFVYLDFLIVAELLSFSLGDSSYLVQIQGEDRDLDQLQTGLSCNADFALSERRQPYKLIRRSDVVNEAG